MSSMRTWVMVAGLVVIAIGIGAALNPSLALIPGAVPVNQVPTSTVTLTTSASGLAVTAHVINDAAGSTGQLANSPTMQVVSDTIYWGTVPTRYAVANLTGVSYLNETYAFAAAGVYPVHVVSEAVLGSSTYRATSATLTVTVPSTSSGSSGSSQPKVSSSFVAQVSGLVVSYSDTSTVSGATITSIAWSFGDGSTGAGPVVNHTYASSGTYEVSETVTATNSTGAVVSSTSEQNVTVASGTSGCQGTGRCAPTAPQYLTPTSGVLTGLGIGLVIGGAFGRPEWIAILAFLGAIVGLLLGYVAPYIL